MNSGCVSIRPMPFLALTGFLVAAVFVAGACVDAGFAAVVFGAVGFVAADFVAADLAVAAFVAVDFFAVDFESTLLGSVTVLSLLAAFVVFLAVDFTDAGAVFW